MASLIGITPECVDHQYVGGNLATLYGGSGEKEHHLGSPVDDQKSGRSAPEIGATIIDQPVAKPTQKEGRFL
jgi:hypothetical protein